MKKIALIALIMCSGSLLAAPHSDQLLQLPTSPATPDTISVIRGDISAGRHTPVIITRPGTYQLAGSLSAAAGNTALTISANNVAVDLAGQTISGGTTGIVIAGNNVTVKNGTIQNSSGAGIILSGSQCQLNGLDVTDSNTGFLLQNTAATMLTNCRALNNRHAGFSLIRSYTNSLINCQAIGTTGGLNSAYGFISQQGSGNTFSCCGTQNTQTNASEESQCAAGFFLSNETASSVSDSQASNTLSTASTTTAYGISLQNTTGCTVTKNTASNTTTINGLGIGISADSSANYVAANAAYNNDINYTGISTSFITSQANARGVYNVNNDLATPDIVQSINTTVTTCIVQDLSIESMTEVLSSNIDTINTSVTPAFASIESTADSVASKIDTSPVSAIASKTDTLAACQATSLYHGGSIQTNKADITNGDVTLSNSGCYCLSSNLGNSSSGASLTITGNNITLDLNGYTIDGNNTKETGITLLGTAITVRNGTVKNAAAQGIAVLGNQCTLENIDVISSPTGYVLTNATYNTLTNCRAIHCTHNGFSLANCTHNTFNTCSALDVGGLYAPVHGFYSTNGIANTFDSCAVIDAYTNSKNSNAVAQGFGFNNENYSSVTNCTINGISTTQSTPTLSGIYALLTNVQELKYAPGSYRQSTAVSWLETQGQRYLAVGFYNASTPPYEITILQYTGTELLYKTSVDWATPVGGVSWLTTGTTNYLAIGSNSNGTGNNEVEVFKFTPPATLAPITGFDHGGIITQVDWLTICSSGRERYYLASTGGSGTDSISVRVHEFNGSNLTQVSSFVTGGPTGGCSWLTIGSDAYLAVGSDSWVTNNLRILKFPFTTSSTPVTMLQLGISIQSARWITTSTGKQYLAVGGSGHTAPQVIVYEFILSSPTTGTLTQKASYRPATGVITGVSWLPGIDDLNYLAICGDASDGYQVHILRFNGSCLTPIFNYSPGATAIEVDWLRTGSTLLAISSNNDTHPVTTLGFSPTLNTITNNTITNVRGGTNATAFAVDANNTLIKNTAYNNDINYFYTPGYGDSNHGY